MAETSFTPSPHAEAAALIRDKPLVSRAVFDRLLPELRARAFTVSGVAGAAVLQRIREAIAGLPAGGTWPEQKAQIQDELEPFLGEEGAGIRAELLLRTHGFEAFNAAAWRVIQEDDDTTHMQYLATEDDRVRPTHLALNGIVLPKDDPFWDDHYPPWEWGCRCRCRPMNPDMVVEEKQADEDRNPEDRNVLHPALARKLRNGQLTRGTRSYDVTPPKDKPEGESAFHWDPDDLRLPLGELKQRYDPEVWQAFELWARRKMAGPGKTIWQWLSETGV